MSFRERFHTKQQVVASPGKRVTSRLENGTQTHAVVCTLTSTLHVTVAGTRVINNGSILAACDELGVVNGKDLLNFEPRTLGLYNAVVVPSQKHATRAASAAVGNYALTEQVIVWCAQPYAATPRETALMEFNVSSVLEFFIKQNGTNGGAAKIVDGTATLDAITCNVEQVHDPEETGLPYFQPRTYGVHQSVQFNAAFNNIPIYLKPEGYLRGIIIQEDTVGAGVQPDVLTQFRLTSGDKDFMPEMVVKDDYQRWNETFFGGDVYAPATQYAGYTVIWFQKGGRLSNLMPPDYKNLRLQVSGGLSAAAGAGNSIINVTLLELVRDLRVDPNSGRRICSETLPFPI